MNRVVRLVEGVSLSSTKKRYVVGDRPEIVYRTHFPIRKMYSRFHTIELRPRC